MNAVVRVAVISVALIGVSLIVTERLAADPEQTRQAPILGLTGKVHDVKLAVPAADRITSLADARHRDDVDLWSMARWAMNNLILKPRKEFDFEPVF